MRDPLVFFKDFLHVDNHSRSDHFESIQSTNWNSVRFKPPPPNNGQPSTFPWRVELRTMEAQVSDLEAAVISSFTALLAQVIVADGLEWYIPISLCDENMRVSYTQKAASEGFFWWRSKSGSPVQARIQEIFEGSDRIDGLMPRLSAFVESNTDCMAAIKRLKVVVGFLQGRASGELITAATYYRQLIVNHPSYQQDGLLTPEIGYAVMSQAFQISVGIMDAEAQAMFGTFAHHRELCCPQECVDTLLSCLTATTAPEVIFPSLPRKRFLTEDLTPTTAESETPSSRSGKDKSTDTGSQKCSDKSTVLRLLREFQQSIEACDCACQRPDGMCNGSCKECISKATPLLCRISSKLGLCDETDTPLCGTRRLKALGCSGLSCQVSRSLLEKLQLAAASMCDE
ncbi:MAG: uncharacterized protein KVP18_003728 [Porospora cf. gigantea A]|uniref:uncharacterized protein n=1 Tax=Porospora cf. gigantea A TaxID=2853593 RepID=UPI00355A1F1D|nr:MAG: hypothetical protein KVP18_003728 [Porospora cf. gigantea A]